MVCPTPLLALLLLGATFPALRQAHNQCLLSQGDLLWAGTFGQGLLRSGDGGRTWRSGGLPTDVTRVLALATLKSSLFAGTGTQGLWRSDDDGQQWARWDAGLPETTTVQALYVDTRDVVWAGTADEGLQTRATRGASWHRVLAWDEASSQMVSHTCGSGTGFALQKGIAYGVESGAGQTVDTVVVGAHDDTFAYSIPPTSGANLISSRFRTTTTSPTWQARRAWWMPRTSARAWGQALPQWRRRDLHGHRRQRGADRGYRRDAHRPAPCRARAHLRDALAGEVQRRAPGDVQPGCNHQRA